MAIDVYRVRRFELLKRGKKKVNFVKLKKKGREKKKTEMNKRKTTIKINNTKE